MHPLTVAARRLTLAAALAGLALVASACGSDSPPPSPTPSGTGAMGGAPATTAPAVTTPAATATGGSGGGGGGGGGGTALPAGWTLCQNNVRGSSMAYPGGWYTTHLRPAEKCSQFHPDEFTIPVAGEYPLTALNAVQTEETVAQYMAGATDTTYVTVNHRSTTTVLGMTAEKFETTSLGEGLAEAGTKVYGYAINRGGRAFVVWAAARPGETRFTAWKTVVDEAITTLRFI